MSEMFEIEKKRSDEDFVFTDVAMRHQNCQGGSVRISEVKTSHGSFFVLICKRCKKRIGIYTSEAAEVISTAVDGKQRDIKARKVVNRKKDLETAGYDSMVVTQKP